MIIWSFEVLINALIVYPPPAFQDHFRIKPKTITPSERVFKKLMGVFEPKICACSLSSVFPKHTMRVLDDGDPLQRLQWKDKVHWTIDGTDLDLFGVGVIFGVSDSYPADIDLNVAELVERLMVLHRA